MKSFDIDEYNYRECEVHNHGFYLGEQSKQAEVDELQKRIDEALKEMKHQLGDEDYDDMQRPDYDAMMYSLRNIKDILKGDQS